MSKVSFRYKEQGSTIFEKVLRPLINLEIRGIVPYSKLTVYLHPLKFRIEQMKFDALIGVSESDEVPPIWGKVAALDNFIVELNRGKEEVFS